MQPQMLRSMCALSFGFILLILAYQNAHAQTAGAQSVNGQCAPRAAVLNALGTKYAEARRAVGMAGQNTVMELFVNPATRSWTITATSPSGVTCLVASGSHFEAVNDPAPAKGSPA